MKGTLSYHYITQLVKLQRYKQLYIYFTSFHVNESEVYLRCNQTTAKEEEFSRWWPQTVSVFLSLLTDFSIVLLFACVTIGSFTA